MPGLGEGNEDIKFMDFLTQGKHSTITFVRKREKCREKIPDCLRNDPISKLLYSAMNSYKCPIPQLDCTYCSNTAISHCFKYDSNETYICMNNYNDLRSDEVCKELNHKLVHAFDNCRAFVKQNSLSHMACTEIRAVNLIDCTSVSNARSWSSLKNSHRECVREKVLAAFTTENVPRERVEKAVDQVFERCYNDLEPFGRRIREFTKDPYTILLEGYFFGYKKVD